MASKETKPPTPALVTPIFQKRRWNDELSEYESASEFVYDEFCICYDAETMIQERKRWEKHTLRSATKNEKTFTTIAYTERKLNCWCPKYKPKRGFGIINADKRDNQLMGIIEPVDGVHQKSLVWCIRKISWLLYCLHIFVKLKVKSHQIKLNIKAY